MKLKLIYFFLSLMLSVSSSHAAVECRVYCNVPGECMTRSADMSPLPNGGWKIASCDIRDRRALAPATVWYSRETLSVVKILPTQGLLSDVVADADSSCSWPFCFRSKTGRVNGGTYMGQGSASEVNDAVMTSGLPFDDVYVSGEALSVRILGAAGTLDLKDAAGTPVGSFPVSNGLLMIPATRLQVGSVYIYQWRLAGSTPITGSFRIAQPGKAKRVHDYAASSNQSTPLLQKIALANAYMSAGLRWNAIALISEIERGE